MSKFKSIVALYRLLKTIWFRPRVALIVSIIFSYDVQYFSFRSYFFSSHSIFRISFARSFSVKSNFIIIIIIYIYNELEWFSPNYIYNDF
jgi:hypothetical protein